MIRHLPGRLLSLILLLLLAGAVQGAGKPQLSKQSFRVLQQAQEWLDGGQTARAISRLQQLAEKTQERPYEQAVVLQRLGYAQIAREDYKAAIASFQRSLKLNQLPDNVQLELRYNLAQLLMATEAFSEAINVLQVWLQQNPTPTAESYVMLGSAYLQTQRYRQGISAFEKAIALSSAPKESWYQNMLAAYSELKDTPGCIKLLNTMVRKFPSRSLYWRQLAGMELSRQRYAVAVAVMELAYRQGHLKSERELLNLANLYATIEAPLKSARLLETELSRGHISPSKNNLEQAANAWYQAKEYARAIALLERALEKARDPALSLRLSQLYITERQWADAERILSGLLAGEKPGVKRDGKAWTLLGIALFEQKRRREAKSAFQAASRFATNSADEARQWLAYLATDE